MPFNIGKTHLALTPMYTLRFRPMPFNIGKIPLYFNPILMTQAVEPIETIRPTLDWIRRLRTLFYE